MLLKIDKVVDKVLSTITTLLYIAMIVVVLLQIVGRYTPSITISWSEELTRLLFVYIVCLGAPLSIRYEEFADVDLIISEVAAKKKRILYIVIYALMVIFCGVMSISGLKFAEIGGKSISPAMKLPMVIHYSSIPITGFLCGIYSLLQLYGIIRNQDVLGGKRKKWQQ